MKKVFLLLSFILLSIAAYLVISHFTENRSIPVLKPQGIVAHHERNLIVTGTLVMLIVVIPVFVVTTVFAFKYRASNSKTNYKPDWHHHRVAETLWWVIPGCIILFLGIMTWRSSHELDPYRPLVSTKKPLTIHVVALQWKWLFIYPEQKIATVNFVQFPEQTPLHFKITADAPMNSFWIPDLGGQIYAMPGMKTQLHLMANKEGFFRGASANFSGEGFAGMTFTASATSDDAFEGWVRSVRNSSQSLGWNEYQQLAKPSKDTPPVFYSLEDEDLYEQIVMQYMAPEEKK